MDNNRIKEINAMIETLRAYWITTPYLRLGQIVSNVAAKQNVDVFYIADAKLTEGIKKEIWDECL